MIIIDCQHHGNKYKYSSYCNNYVEMIKQLVKFVIRHFKELCVYAPV